VGLLAVGLKEDHDGAVAVIADNRLVASLEPEKDSGVRYGSLQPSTLLQVLPLLDRTPDLWATGGWHLLLPGYFGSTQGGYEGLANGQLEKQQVCGASTWFYHTSHERSHLFGAVAMSPFADADDIAVLVWEGTIGSFYRFSGGGTEIRRFEVLGAPGARYAGLYALADPRVPNSSLFEGSHAGKLMALAGFSDGQEPSADSKAVVRELLAMESLYPFIKTSFRWSKLYNCGVTHAEVARAARLLTDELFSVFLRGARRAFRGERLPLVIAGGCGLNCEWNSLWRRSGVFSQVFVPPCPNDSGSSIGAAVDGLVQIGESPGIDWTVYAGAEFVHDVPPDASEWENRPLVLEDVVERLSEGAVLAWVQGRYEIGPRALGNRSLLASATEPESAATLNRLKQRESYRPVAPICLEEDARLWFDDGTPDPFMLYFRRVTRPDVLPSITHRDGSARVQTVTAESNPRMAELLSCYRQLTGVSVLCNTSLNYPGRGFINRASDLFRYCDYTGIGDVVIDEKYFRRRQGRTAGA
jgi:hydroxymethyl cephem carbamoyltransferase